MSAPILAVILIGNLIATSYRSVPAQTKPKDCDWTASGEKCNAHGCAVSQDLLKRWGGPLQFGDLIYVDGVGYKFVNDVMNARHHHRVDIWVQTYQEEKMFDKKFRDKPLRVWYIRQGALNETQARPTKTKAHPRG